jgi:DNA-binding PadR family transcriptional regulator
MTSNTGIDDALPLTESTFLILLSLAPGPRHGYAILKDVATLSRERVQLSTGTLYGALKRLLAEGWIRRATEDVPAEAEADHPGRPRRYYALTDRGRRLLEAETARLESLAAAAAQVRTGEMQA